MKKLILSVFLMVAVSAGAFAQADKSAAASNAPVMKFDKEEFSFGTIKQGDKVEHSFEFVNTGTSPLIITEAHGSCGCTVPEWPKEPLKKGEKGIIKVTFNSAGKMGLQDKTITITSNAADSPKILHIKGNIEASADAKPADTPKN